MHTLSVAQAKAHLSEALARVEAGDELIITRRGRPVARLVPERSRQPASAAFDLARLEAFVDAQPEAPGNSVVDMRATEPW